MARTKHQKSGKQKPRIYVTNAQLYDALVIAHQKNEITPELADIFMKMTEKLANSYNFSGYSYIEDMKGEALVILCHNWKTFKINSNRPPFPYFTQIIYNVFIQVIQKEKKTSKLKDYYRLMNGLEPTSSYEE